MKTILVSLVAGLFTLNPGMFAAAAGNKPLLSRGCPLEAAPVPETEPEHQASRTQRLSQAQSARKAGDLARAISIYKEMVALEPGHLETRIELAATLTEAALFNEARGHLDCIQRSRPSWVPVYLRRGALEQQAQNEISALKAFDQALSIDPANQMAREGRLLALSRLGSPTRALAEAKEYPDLDPGIMQRLHEDEAALAIRRSENVYHEYPSSALPAADTAIALIEANLKRYPGSERSRYDYVRALTNRRRHRDAITAYEALMAEKRVIPGYTHQSAAESYLAEQLPERAKETFKAALTADPNDFNANAGLFYALSDLNEFAAAKTHVDALAARPLEPEMKFEAERLAIWADAYEDRLGIAQDRFSALQTRAPASAALHNALGRIYLWRGWPRRAGEEFNLVAQQHPYDMEAQFGLADVDRMLGDFNSAKHRTAYLSTLAADDHEGVKRLRRAQTLHNRPELTVSSGSRQNKERTSNGQSLRLDTRLYSAPVTPQNRIFAHQYYESTHFGAESAYYKRIGLGWEAVIARVAKLEIEIQHESFRDNRNSALLAGEIQLNDFWQIKCRYDRNSLDVPLRGRLSDIGGKAVSVGGRYRPNERAAIDAGAQHLTLSDGNDRRSRSASGEYQFIQGPSYKATAALDMSASTNTFADAVYFNPARDRTLQITLKNEWLGYRRYTRSFYQRLYLSTGGYTQQDFATQTIGSLRYEHEWNLSDAMNVRYGLAYVRTAFDGESSKGPEATISMSWRF